MRTYLSKIFHRFSGSFVGGNIRKLILPPTKESKIGQNNPENRPKPFTEIGSRTVAILTGPDTHLDHLGVLSALLKIPLVLTEESNFHLAQTFYPDFNAELKGLDELSLEHLTLNYDAIFETGKFFAAELRPLMELLFRKKMRFVFCPHGNSDKGHSLQHHVQQDVSLVYGDHLRDLLIQNGAAEKIRHMIRTGNYRYPYYLSHQKFFDSLAEEKVFSKFANEKPVIFYAPTWSDRENPTSFFSATDRLVEELSPSYNLLIKLHPFLIDDHPASTFYMMARYEKHPSALFVTDFPPIYPLLSRCALYLGDYSSIGYDFLAFDKPLYFLNPGSSPIHTCGLQVPTDGDLNKFLTLTLEDSTHRFAQQRKKVYHYAFGEELSSESVKESIFQIINSK